MTENNGVDLDKSETAGWRQKLSFSALARSDKRHKREARRLSWRIQVQQSQLQRPSHPTSLFFLAIDGLP